MLAGGCINMHSKLKCANVSLQLYDAGCGLSQVNFFLPVQHPESFLSPSALCVLWRSGGWKRLKINNTLFNHQCIEPVIYVEQQKVSQNWHCVLTTVSIKSWRGVWAADPGPTGTALHHSYKSRSSTFIRYRANIDTPVTDCETSFIVCLTPCRKIKGSSGFAYRRRCCRMEILVCSSRSDGSNISDSTPSLFRIKLQEEHHNKKCE